MFRRSEHPSFLVQTFEFKEGFSLFNLYDFTVTLDGRLALKQIMARPLVDVELIEQRQGYTEALSGPIARHGKRFYGEAQKALKLYRSFESRFGKKAARVVARPNGTLSWRSWA